MQKNPTILVILDGFGYAPSGPNNPINKNTMPVFTQLLKEYPHTLLQASGEYVGLPPGVMGNSQAGHTTIGAGRVVEQPVTIINDAIAHHTLAHRRVIHSHFKALANTENALHIMGLLSDASVHSHEKHLLAYMRIAQEYGIKRVYIHAFLDGRDTPPQSASIYLERLEKTIKSLMAHAPTTQYIIGSLHGRFYAMDRDHNWERTAQSYRVLITQMRNTHTTWQEAIDQSYANNITDEFFIPLQLDPHAYIQPHDGVLFINFRPDRARQLTSAFTDTSCPLFNNNTFNIIQTRPAFFITPVSYEHTGITVPEEPSDQTISAQQSLPNLFNIFASQKLSNTLMDKIAQLNLQAYLIAETEKYAHVTYFLCGGREYPLPNETQVHIPSIKTNSYANYPCMSAPEITQHVLDALKQSQHDFYVINYANADMVGHTGDFNATGEALTCLDQQLKQLFDAVSEQQGTLFITGDHGNAEQMIDPHTGAPCTAHTTNPVYFVAICTAVKQIQQHELPQKSLSDVAEVVLHWIVHRKPHHLS